VGTNDSGQPILSVHMQPPLCSSSPWPMRAGGDLMEGAPGGPGVEGAPDNFAPGSPGLGLSIS
jgi:hypothetical protein